MGQVLASFDFPADDVALLAPCSPLAVAIFADRPYLRTEMAEDAAAAGLRVTRTAGLRALLEEPEQPLGDLVLVDCPVIESADIAALARLDMRAARTGARLVVSTSMGSLDDVFGSLDQCDPQILVSPSRADRVIALGRLLTSDGARVRELSDHDRISLLRLTEQVAQIAQRLETLSSPGNGNQTVEAPAFGFGAESLRDEASRRLVRPARASLPDPRLVRKIIRQRQMRARFFEGDLFADPAWDMLLDLTAARAEHKRVSVTSLCIASGVPPTTALRWIGQMTDCGLFARCEDDSDRRRAFISLSDKAAEAMSHYFAEVETAGLLI
ncbi:conserved hypothetical protein [Novosphingobium aromaticivorans DSM 12444]|uniref:Uncharacterized protein n=1 Tax=Novosphingobium aromaticivorans (strain ATCC 700278 / DSM 12444 / CCUG 56034 / CIP 105152 / NBRC 16084 / F199) TaxID=279238 RepID=Q2G4V2_NOVAD|nr:hypothetical protein [Novosphingobium aromaticivorans]ABD27121.1 conserved hypothetical protein [Novosphingobium aromaticivorans DSM 12444]SCY89030.1 hypothetical protein SAMN05660666_03433 [Novosphingobium aromaticivorans]